MKKILFSCCALLLAFAAQSQTEKGDWLVGGSMTISTPSNNSSFTLQPNGGYFLARGLAVGANLALNFSSTGGQKTNSESAGPFARYYFNLRSPEFKPLIHAEVNWGNSVTKYNDTKSSNTFGNFFLGAGGAFFINSNVAIEGVAGYSHSKLQGSDASNGFLFRLGFQVHLLGGEVDKLRGN